MRNDYSSNIFQDDEANIFNQTYHNSNQNKKNTYTGPQIFYLSQQYQKNQVTEKEKSDLKKLKYIRKISKQMRYITSNNINLVQRLNQPKDQEAINNLLQIQIKYTQIINNSLQSIIMKKQKKGEKNQKLKNSRKKRKYINQELERKINQRILKYKNSQNMSINQLRKQFDVSRQVIINRIKK